MTQKELAREIVVERGRTAGRAADSVLPREYKPPGDFCFV